MKKAASVLLALGVFVLGIFLLFVIVRAFDEWFVHTNSKDKPASITAVGLIIVAAITYLFNRGADRRRILEELTRKAKIDVYENIVTFLLQLFMTAPSLVKPSEGDTQDFFAETTPRLMTYGSNAVVKQWGKFIRSAPSLATMDPWNAMIMMEHFLKSMRKDVGHRSLTLMDGDLARLFINDIDETIAARKLRKPSSR